MTDYKRILTIVSHNALRVKDKLPLGRRFESYRRSHFKSLNLNGLGDFTFRGKANYDRNYARWPATLASSLASHPRSAGCHGPALVALPGSGAG